MLNINNELLASAPANVQGMIAWYWANYKASLEESFNVSCYRYWTIQILVKKLDEMYPQNENLKWPSIIFRLMFDNIQYREHDAMIPSQIDVSDNLLVEIVKKVIIHPKGASNVYKKVHVDYNKIVKSHNLDKNNRVCHAKCNVHCAMKRCNAAIKYMRDIFASYHKVTKIDSGEEFSYNITESHDDIYLNLYLQLAGSDKKEARGNIKITGFIENSRGMISVEKLRTDINIVKCVIIYNCFRIDGMHACVPPDVYDLLAMFEDIDPADIIECYSSPFNKTRKIFCTAYAFDNVFGSIGPSYGVYNFDEPTKSTLYGKTNFFSSVDGKHHTLVGTFSFNPIYTEVEIDCLSYYVIALMDNYKKVKKACKNEKIRPLICFVVHANWRDATGIKNFNNTKHIHGDQIIELNKGDYSYVSGEIDGVVSFKTNFDTIIWVLSSEPLGEMFAKYKREVIAKFHGNTSIKK